MAKGMDQDALVKAEALLYSLQEYKNNTKITNNTKDSEDAEKNEESVEQKLKDTLCELDQLQLSIENKAAFFYLRGKALNSISSKYDSKAVECLSKAVKLDPSHVDAWNELGECYWKCKDVESAANCFRSALSKRENKVSLRNLSMVQRQLGPDFESKVANIKRSVETAKQALKLDITDGQSWFVLGNAYLSVFFYAGQSPNVLRQCMVAYSKAEKDEKQLSNPDLYYNRAVAYKYQEHFRCALADYKKAYELDPSWVDPKDDLEDLLKRLRSSVELIEQKGNQKQKKISMLISTIKESDLGPFSSGTYVSPLNKTIKLSRVLLKDLNAGANSNAIIHGKVVAIIPVKDSVPFPFILLDGEGTCIAVSVFNLAVGKGMIVGDSVAISEPFVEDVILEFDNENISYRSIRVDNPVVMVINKRKVGADRLAFSILSVSNKPDEPRSYSSRELGKSRYNELNTSHLAKYAGKKDKYLFSGTFAVRT